MNNSIKEILDDYKKLAGEITEKLDNTAEYESWLIIQDYVDEFLNYITNLQKENLALARENEQEKQFIKDCGFENTQQLALEYISLREEKEIYKQRNEKAVESIKDCKKVNGDEHTCIIDHNYLLNILQGGDE